MESYNIVNIQEIETFKKGESYKGKSPCSPLTSALNFSCSEINPFTFSPYPNFLATELHFSDQPLSVSFSKNGPAFTPRIQKCDSEIPKIKNSFFKKEKFQT